MSTFRVRGVFSSAEATISYPQPWLTDIEFDNGSIIFTDAVRISDERDRLCHASVRWMSNATGVTTHTYRLADSEPTQSGFGRANSLGDVVALRAPAPIEIGNRVWYDRNHNGIQDPDLAIEAPVSGVTVRLYDDSGTFITQMMTTADGTYYFNETNVPGGLQPGNFYNIRLDKAADYTEAGSLAGWMLTTANQGTDVSDSDGTIINGFPNIRVQVGDFGENDHTFDFGFSQTAATTPDSSQPPETDQKPWWRLPLLIAGIVLGMAALRLTLRHRSHSV